MKYAEFTISNDFILQLEKEIANHEKELLDDPDNVSLKGRIDGLRRALLVYRMLLSSKDKSRPISIEID